MTKQNNRNHTAECVRRLELITSFFRGSSEDQQSAMLDRLKLEINQTTDPAIKNWLIRFDSILRTMEVN